VSIIKVADHFSVVDYYVEVSRNIYQIKNEMIGYRSPVVGGGVGDGVGVGKGLVVQLRLQS
jgi:hypothetical protein